MNSTPQSKILHSKRYETFEETITRRHLEWSARRESIIKDLTNQKVENGTNQKQNESLKKKRRELQEQIQIVENKIMMIKNKTRKERVKKKLLITRISLRKSIQSFKDSLYIKKQQFSLRQELQRETQKRESRDSHENNLKRIDSAVTEQMKIKNEAIKHYKSCKMLFQKSIESEKKNIFQEKRSVVLRVKKDRAMSSIKSYKFKIARMEDTRKRIQNEAMEEKNQISQQKDIARKVIGLEKNLSRKLLNLQNENKELTSEFEQTFNLRLFRRATFQKKISIGKRKKMEICFDHSDTSGEDISPMKFNMMNRPHSSNAKYSRNGYSAGSKMMSMTTTSGTRKSYDCI